jgi:hypothetical protein
VALEGISVYMTFYLAVMGYPLRSEMCVLPANASSAGWVLAGKDLNICHQSRFNSSPSSIRRLTWPKYTGQKGINEWYGLISLGRQQIFHLSCTVGKQWSTRLGRSFTTGKDRGPSVRQTYIEIQIQWLYVQDFTTHITVSQGAHTLRSRHSCVFS